MFMRMNSWTDILPSEWLESANFGDIVLEGYASSLSSGSKARTVALEAKELLQNVSSHPVTFSFVSFDEPNNIGDGNVSITYLDGQRIVDFQLGERKIPKGDYVVIGSPELRIHDGGANAGIATNALNAARGLLMSLAGHTAAEQLAFTFRLNKSTNDRLSYTSRIIENFRPSDEFLFCTMESIRELAKRTGTHLTPDHRRRFETSLIFLGRAAGEMDATVRFTHMWIALEVVAGGYGKIDALLTRVSSGALLKQKLKQIKSARDGLFHHGRRFGLAEGQERLICAAILSEFLHHYRVVDPALQTYLAETALMEMQGHDLSI